MTLQTVPYPLKPAFPIRQSDTPAGIRLFDCGQNTLNIGRVGVTNLIDVDRRRAGDVLIKQRILILQLELLKKSIFHQVGTKSFHIKSYASGITSQMLVLQRLLVGE